MQAEELIVEIKRLCQKHNHLSQEAEDAEKQGDKMSNWVCDLMDQRHNVKADIWRLKQELKKTTEELTQLKVRKKEMEASGLSLMPVVTSSVSGQQSQGASAEPGATKRMKRNKQKRHPGLPLQEGQEYYKSYLAHL